MNPERNSLSFPQYIAGTLFGLAVSVALAAVAAVPAGADILVMQDGSRLEIQGEWRDRGRVIEFTLPNGTLGSVRAAEVDVEASVEATRLANEPPKPEPVKLDKEKPAPIAVWTNSDIPQAAPDVLAGESASLDAKSVQVTGWQAEPGADANVVTTIRGSLQNYGNNQITGLSLSVTVVGNRPNGAAPSLVRQARLDSTSLGPGETTGFMVEVRRGDVITVGLVEEFESPSASFDVLFESNPTEAEAPPEAASEDDEG